MHARIRRIRTRLRNRRLLQFHRFTRDEQGLQLVEAAIVIPIFLLLFAATAEFGRYFYEYTTLAKGTRAGARYLVTAQLSAAEKTNVKNIVVFGNPSGTGDPILPGLDIGDVEITQAGGPAITPHTVTVKIVGYEYEPIFDLGLFTKNDDLSLNIAVSPSVTMRYLLTQPPPL